MQHVLVPVEVGEIPFYSRMRQIPCESCWKARCLTWIAECSAQQLCAAEVDHVPIDFAGAEMRERQPVVPVGLANHPLETARIGM